MSTTTLLLASFPVESEMRFPVSDGGALVFQRGTIRCEVAFLEIPEKRHRYSDEWDTVLGCLDVTDQRGVVFRLERELSAKWFLELLRMGRSHGIGEPRLILGGVHCGYDHRTYIPAVGISEGKVVSLAYRGKHLVADMDLMADRIGDSDQLVIRVQPTLGATVDGKDSPTISVWTDWAAKLVVWPSLVVGLSEPLGEQPVFTPTHRKGKPQLLVESVDPRR